MEEGLYTYLAAQAAVANIVGTQIYQGYAPQGVDLPFLVCTVLNVEDMADHGGGSGLATTTIRIDCYETTYAAAKNLAAAVRGELHGFGNGTMGSQFVRSCLKVGERDTVSQPVSGNESPVQGKSLTFDFVHPVSVPSFA